MLLLLSAFILQLSFNERRRERERERERERSLASFSKSNVGHRPLTASTTRSLENKREDFAIINLLLVVDLLIRQVDKIHTKSKESDC
jgi:hypothetical protein